MEPVLPTNRQLIGAAGGSTAVQRAADGAVPSHRQAAAANDERRLQRHARVREGAVQTVPVHLPAALQGVGDGEGVAVGQARIQGCHGSRPCAVETAAGAEGDSLRLHRHVCAYHHTTQCLSAVCVRGGAAAAAVAVVVTCSVFKVFESVSLRVGCWRLVARPRPR